ncbi:MAG: hypothetical protein JXR95_00925 [Deltaproteobacteria bacterium]|nr:hypothetical protein [Deltaproteobacteria bacterium]
MYYLGIDAGSVNVKTALYRGGKCIHLGVHEIKEEVSSAVFQALKKLPLNENDKVRVTLTGSSRQSGSFLPAAALMGEMIALPLGVSREYPQCRTIFDLGAEFSKWIELDESGSVVNFNTNGLCAAGAGAFLHQQSSRLGITLDEMSEISMKAASGAKIAGRCSVFAKSDMIHLQQKGIEPSEIAYGLCQALMRTFNSSVVKGKKIEKPLVVTGGTANNKGIIRAIMEIFSLEKNDIIHDEKSIYLQAKGAALSETGFETVFSDLCEEFHAMSVKSAETGAFPVLSNGTDIISGGDERPENVFKKPVKGFLGLDVGSVSTNLVVMSEKLEFLYGIYLPTRGEPARALSEGMRQIREITGDNLEIIGSAATGSGRHLAASLLGVDVVRNEITAQMVGTAHFFPEVDTIFEIGGQDSKYISVESGEMKDFEMNKICAAGTGSFLEEQSHRLGINIIGEFSSLALKADTPVDLGSQCTVFMDSELVKHQHRNVSVENLCAGLAYSVARNYLEKVVAHRNVGDFIVFQGGTASNTAVVKAFENLLGRKIHIHPYNRISGAIGCAVLAQKANVKKTLFKGLDFDSTEYSISTFECKSCSNNCQVSRIKTSSGTVYFGDACEKFSSFKKSVSTTSGYFDEIREIRSKYTQFSSANGNSMRTLGLINGSTNARYLPLWKKFLTILGYNVVVSPETSEKTLEGGSAGVPGEVCMPMKIAAAQVRALIEEEKVDAVFMPSVLEMESPDDRDASARRNIPGREQYHTCVYTQELPFMISRHLGKAVLTPQFSLDAEGGGLLEAVSELSEALGRKPAEIKKAYIEATNYFLPMEDKIIRIGSRVLEEEKGNIALLIGRPYTIYDSYLNMGLSRHLEKIGFNVITMDSMDLDDITLGREYSKLPWGFSRESVKACKKTLKYSNVFPVILSTFGCGPDAFTHKHLEEILGDRPHLVLEFDEHRGEAGMVTRLEAFADRVNAYNLNITDNHHSISITEKTETEKNPSLNGLPKRVFFPWMGPHTRVYSSLVKSLDPGIEIVLLPPPDEDTLRYGEEISSGKECHPYTFIASDLVKLARNGVLRQGDAFMFVSTVNPCLLPQYGDALKLWVRKNNIPVRIMDFTATEMLDLYGYERLKLIVEGTTAMDALMAIRGRLAPYAKSRNAVNSIIEEAYIGVGEDLSSKRSPANAISRAVKALESLEYDYSRKLPLVGVFGDLYTRLADHSNGNIVDKLEEAGCEVHLSPYMASLVDFSNYADASRWAQRGQTVPMLWETFAIISTTIAMNTVFNAIGDDFITLINEPSFEEIMELVAPYTGKRGNYLISSSIGKFAHFAESNYDGVLNVIGVNCMVGCASGSAMEKMRQDYSGVPMLTISYGRSEGQMHAMRLETFIHQVKEFNSSHVRSAVPEKLAADR